MTLACNRFYSTVVTNMHVWCNTFSWDNNLSTSLHHPLQKNWFKKERMCRPVWTWVLLSHAGWVGTWRRNNLNRRRNCFRRSKIARTTSVKWRRVCRIKMGKMLRITRVILSCHCVHLSEPASFVVEVCLMQLGGGYWNKEIQELASLFLFC